MRHRVRGILPRKLFSISMYPAFASLSNCTERFPAVAPVWLAEEDKVGAFNPDEDRHDGQPQLRVQQGIQFFEHGFRVMC